MKSSFSYGPASLLADDVVIPGGVDVGEELHPIQLGNDLACPDAFLEAFQQRGVHLDGNAQRVLQSPDFHVSRELASLAPVLISVSDLGLPNGGLRRRIYHRARRLGLVRGPTEAAFQLRLAYLDQPKHHHAVIAAGHLGEAAVFRIRRGCGSRWLHARPPCEPDIYGPYSNFIFFRRPAA